MTDASFVARMGTDRVIDRVAPLRRVRQRAFNNFQAAMQPNPKINGGQWGAAEKIAVGCFVGFVAAIMLAAMLMGAR